MADVEQERHEKIRALAHRIWEIEGRPEGRSQEHWDLARQQVMAAEEEAAAHPAGSLGSEVADDIDRAVADSFPASDPVQGSGPVRTGKPAARKAAGGRSAKKAG